MLVKGRKSATDAFAFPDRTSRGHAQRAPSLAVRDSSRAALSSAGPPRFLPHPDKVNGSARLEPWRVNVSMETISSAFSPHPDIVVGLRVENCAKIAFCRH